MNISLLNIMHNKVWDFRPDLAQTYADALKNAISLHIPNDIEKQEGYFLSKKGYQKDGKTVGANFEDKLYVGDIHRIERHLYWNDEELQEDDQIINVVVVDGPVTRDGDGCSYGTKDFRDQVMYANTIPQVVGHLFIINTPGGQASCRNDYEMMIEDCRKNGKPTVAFVDGMCCSSGVNLACRCDRTIVMNAKDEFGCIGTMAAFWAIAHDTISDDGFRYVELVGKDCPEKNDWYREAAKGEYEKLQAELDKDTEDFHNEVRAGRPLVTDDMLTGKVFEAQEVIPALVDEIGDMDRAIECIFELAGGNLTAAHLVTAEPKEDNPLEEDLVPGEEDITHQTIENMTEQEIKAQEAAAAQAEQEQAQEQAQEQEQVQENEQQEQQAQEQEQVQENEQHQEQQAEEQEAQEAEQQEQEQAPASEETIENAQAEIDKIQETLHNAEQMIADKDKEIAGMQKAIDEKKEAFDMLTETFNKQTDEIEDLNSQLSEKDATIAERDKSIEEKDALIESLKKQVSDLKAEVKELAGKPAPMTDEKSGIPADNGTGDAPKVKTSRVKRGMSYHQIREAMKEDK